jgi:hypothetical protein
VGRDINFSLVNWVVAAAGEPSTWSETTTSALKVAVGAVAFASKEREAKAWREALQSLPPASAQLAERIVDWAGSAPASEVAAQTNDNVQALLLCFKAGSAEAKEAATRAVRTHVERLAPHHRSAFVSHLGALVPAVVQCAKITEDTALKLAALDCLSSLISLLRGSMRPYLSKIEGAAVLSLDSPLEEERRSASTVIHFLPSCGTDVPAAWGSACTSLSLEGLALLRSASPQAIAGGVAPQEPARLVFPPLADLGAQSQLKRMETICSRFSGLSMTLSLMLRGSSAGQAVTVPVGAILAMVEAAYAMRALGRRGIQSGKGMISSSEGALPPAAIAIAAPSCERAAFEVFSALTSVPVAALARHVPRLVQCTLDLVQCTSAEGAPRLLGSLCKRLGAACAPNMAKDAIPLLVSLSGLGGVDPPEAADGVPSHASKAASIARAGSLPKLATSSGGVTVATSARKTSRRAQKKGKQKAVMLVENASAGLSEQKPKDSQICFDKMSAPALEALSDIVSICGPFLPAEPRKAAEAVAAAGLVGIASSSEGMALPPRCAAGILRLATACIQAPLSDGTRSSLAPIAIPAFEAMKGSGDERVVTAALSGIVAVQSLLAPRAAPLHVPAALAQPSRMLHGAAQAWDMCTAVDSEADEDWTSAPMGEKAGELASRPAEQDQAATPKGCLPSSACSPAGHVTAQEPNVEAASVNFSVSDGSAQAIGSATAAADYDDNAACAAADEEEEDDDVAWKPLVEKKRPPADASLACDSEEKKTRHASAPSLPESTSVGAPVSTSTRKMSLASDSSSDFPDIDVEDSDAEGTRE